MTRRTYQIIQGAILTGWGVFILQKIVSGNYLLYINRRYEGIILAAALFFLVLAVAVIGIHLFKTRTLGHPDEHHRADAAGDAPPPTWGLLLLAAPLLLGALIPPRPLSSSVMANRGVNASAPLSRLRGSSTSSLSLASNEKTILDWVGDFSSSSDPGSFEGQLADVTGFVYHDPRLTKGQFFVGRFVITCCVADAVALGVVVDSPDAAKFPDNSWVEVQGSIYTADVGGQKLPGITATSLRPMPSPNQPYLFP